MAKSKVTTPTRKDEYKRVFSPYTRLRQRIDSILEGNGDPYPGTSGNEIIDNMLAALAEGKENPYAMLNDYGKPTRRTPRNPDDYPLVRNVAAALIVLF